MMKRKKSTRGQVIVEYVLLIVVSAGLASIIVKQMVSRNDAEAGVLTNKWYEIVKAISADLPEK